MKFKLLKPRWNHLFSPRDKVWRRTVQLPCSKAKRIVSTDSGTPKSQNPSFWHSTVCASAIRGMSPGRCIWALSVYRSRLAPWTRGSRTTASQFLTLDSRIPAEGCFEHEKIVKNHQFDTFGRFSLIFLSLEKTAVWGNRRHGKTHNQQKQTTWSKAQLYDYIHSTASCRNMLHKSETL